MTLSKQKSTASLNNFYSTVNSRHFFLVISRGGLEPSLSILDNHLNLRKNDNDVAIKFMIKTTIIAVCCDVSGVV